MSPIDPPCKIGETLRILSVVTRFGVGGPPLQEDGGRSRKITSVLHSIAFFHLIRLIRKYQSDIIPTHTAKPGVLGRIAFHGNVLPGYLRALGAGCLHKMEQILAAIGRAFFALSCLPYRQTSGEISDEFSIADQKNVRTLPLGLPLHEFEKLAAPSLDRKELVVAWFGRLVAVKNVPLLVEVIEQSLKAIPEIRFLIAGDGPERAAVKGLVERSAGRVEYLGWPRNVASVIERADLLMQTSVNEGTPTALIQGMAAARPFLSTDVPGVADMVTGEEQPRDRARWFTNGVLVPQKAPPFVAVLQAFAKNRALLPQMGLVGRQWSLTNYAAPPPLPPGLAAELSMTRQLSHLARQTAKPPYSDPERMKHS